MAADQSIGPGTSPKTPGNQRRWGCVLLVLLVLILYYGSYIVFQGARPVAQLIAHRGSSAHRPENTIAAFNHAIEQGADWIEFDVQRTQDGVLVVIHDETVDRTTDGTGQVRELTFEQIRALDAGEGQQVPTLKEVVEVAKETNVGILPEVKSPALYPGIEAQIVTELTDTGYAQRAVVQSFEPDALDELLKVDANIQVCPLSGLWSLDLSDPRPGGAKILCPMAEMVLLNPWMILQAHRAGRQVYVWYGVVEHSLTMRLMLALGVDGLMVDDTLALADIMGRGDE